MRAALDCNGIVRFDLGKFEQRVGRLIAQSDTGASAGAVAGRP